MIHSITANHSSFNPVEFTPGLNVILADRTETSTQKDTRNGLGKSTLIEIIHFCLGSNVQKGQGLSIGPLRDWEFTLEITLAGNRVKVTRAVAKPNIFVIDGTTTGWIDQPDREDMFGNKPIKLKLDQWRAHLGWALFGLSPSDEPHSYTPSFRSLLSYFIRLGNDAYDDPFRHTRQQQPWDVQLHVGFLLGLNWENAARWQELKDQEKGVKAFSQAIKSGVTEYARGSVGELEAERVQLESQLEQESHALQNFKVHPQYESIQQEADRATTIIHNLTNDNVVDRRRLVRYRESVAAEKPPSDTAIDELYKEAGVVFFEATHRTLAEAKEFHSKIVENRRAFLEMEIVRLERQIENRNKDIRKWTDTRATSLEILRTHGALQELTKLQERHAGTRERLESVRTRISEIRDLTAQKRKVLVEKTELAQITERDHEQRRDVWNTPVRFFNDNSQALYKTPGHLVIDIGGSGFKYDVEINRSGSEGVSKMKIFCFDLMLLQLMPIRKNPIDFLIHDSGLYDGVDSRQRALALERACEVSEATNTQYICTLNSDMVPRDDFSAGFDFDKHVRLTLTDKNLSGSLLGFQFEM